MGTQMINRGPLSHEEIMEERLERRYNARFVVDNILANNMLDGFYTAIAHPASNPNLHFRVSAEIFDEGISDNYVCKLVQSRIADTIAHNLDMLNGIYVIFCKPLTDTFDLDDPAMNAEEYMKHCPGDKFKIYMNYCVSELDAGRVSEALANALEGLECISGTIGMYLMDEKSMCKVVDYINNNDGIYHDYKSISEKYFKGNIEYESGKMISDKQIVMDMLR